MTVLSSTPGGNRPVSLAEKQLAMRMFSTLGRCRFLDEKHMDAVTGLSGSGPAFAWYDQNIYYCIVSNWIALSWSLLPMEGSCAVCQGRFPSSWRHKHLPVQRRWCYSRKNIRVLSRTKSRHREAVRLQDC